MSDNQEVLKERLQQLLAHKKSRKYYAKKLGVSEEEVKSAMDSIKKSPTETIQKHIYDLKDLTMRLEEDIEKGTGELTANINEEIKTLEQLIEKCKIDTNKWKIDRYIQNFWGNEEDPHWQVKAFLSKKGEQDNFQKNFIDFLKVYSPQINIVQPIYPPIVPRNCGCLIINKQDEHLNKYDIKGDNDIDTRFLGTYDRVQKVLINSTFSVDLQKIVYILGSDEFNSEWTKSTTKGTPQENMLPYHEGFERICNYEVNMIQLLLSYSENVDVIYVAGNHDEYVGWHLVSWLKAFFKDEIRISFDLSPRYRKYMRFGKSAIMFNHGDALKPPRLAGIFPMEFKEAWSESDNFYIFTGDKHHEISMDFNGIKFYQIPALSKARSSWDDKQGYMINNSELTAFLLEDNQGIIQIFKEKV